MNHLLINSESRVVFLKQSENLQYFKLDNRPNLSKDNILSYLNNLFTDICDFKKNLKITKFKLKDQNSFLYSIRLDDTSLIKIIKNNSIKLIHYKNILDYKFDDIILNSLETLFKILNKANKRFAFDLEKIILKKYNLFKKNDRVLYVKANYFAFSKYQLKILLNYAILKKEKLFRVCIHKDDNEQIHEMIMFHTKSQFIGPLCQPNKTSISFNVIEGILNIKLYRKNGDLYKVFKLDSEIRNKPSFLRLDARNDE